VVDDLASRDVHQHRARIEHVQLLGADHSVRRRDTWRREYEHVAACECVGETIWPEHSIDELGAWFIRPATNARDSHTESMGAARDLETDRAESDDGHRAAVEHPGPVPAQLVLNPTMFALRGEGAVVLSREHQESAHDVFGHRDGLD